MAMGLFKTKGKPGALSRMLGIPQKENIPFTFLRKIVGTPIGGIAENPTKTGKSEVRVTTLLKRRALWALNVKTVTRNRARR